MDACAPFGFGLRRIFPPKAFAFFGTSTTNTHNGLHTDARRTFPIAQAPHRARRSPRALIKSAHKQKETPALSGVSFINSRRSSLLKAEPHFPSIPSYEGNLRLLLDMAFAFHHVCACESAYDTQVSALTPHFRRIYFDKWDITFHITKGVDFRSGLLIESAENAGRRLAVKLAAHPRLAASLCEALCNT